MKHWNKLVLGVAALATVVIAGGGAYAASSGSTKAKDPVVQKAQASRAGKSVGQAEPKTSSQENTSTDPDNIQSGDQSAPDTPGQGEEQSSESSESSESSAEPEQGQPGEPAQGHEDPPGNVNHEANGIE